MTLYGNSKCEKNQECQYCEMERGCSAQKIQVLAYDDNRRYTPAEIVRQVLSTLREETLRVDLSMAIDRILEGIE
jgi:hypothetical protein